jgi:hypothetical protein
MLIKSRNIVRKQRFVFIAIKSKSLRTIRINGHDEQEATERVKQKYPGWMVRPYSTSLESFTHEFSPGQISEPLSV